MRRRQFRLICLAPVYIILHRLPSTPLKTTIIAGLLFIFDFNGALRI